MVGSGLRIYKWQIYTPQCLAKAMYRLNHDVFLHHLTIVQNNTLGEGKTVHAFANRFAAVIYMLI